MTADNKETPGSELVRLSDQNGHALVALDGAAYESKKYHLKKRLKEADGTGLWATQTAMIGSTVALIFTPAAPLAIIPGLASLLCVLFRGAEYNPTFKAQEQVEEFKKELTQEFKEAQEQLYQSFQTKLINEAEKTLAEGGLIDEEKMAHLACVRPELLKEASDQLAISVLQARQLLDFSRKIEDPAALDEPKTQPFTFKSQKLKASNEYQRTVFRHNLWSQLKEERVESIGGFTRVVTQKIAEDDFPKHQAPEFGELTGAYGHIGGWGAYLFGPLVDWKLRKNIVNDFMPVAAAKVPPAAKAEDFSQRLAHYESNVEPLDLPAMRGWELKKTLKPQ
jgi:hypothetical protein